VLNWAGRAVVPLLVAMLLGVPSGLTALASTPATPQALVASHIYDGHHHAATEAHTIAERGPPAVHDLPTAYDDVASWSDGPSARLPRAPLPTTYPYDYPPPLAQAARPTSTTNEQAQVAGADWSSLARTGVAAKTPIGPGWFPHGTNKVPSGWSGPGMTKKFRQDPGKEGFVWRGPKQSSVRIDRGNPSSPYPSQQVDHVVINDGGRIVGRDGQLLPPGTRISDVPDQAHIPLSEWNTWGSWNGY
jgi:hypothetical protein